MTVVQMWQYLSRAEQHHMASVPFELAFWRKMLIPLTYLSMALMALAVVIGPLRHTSIGQRLTVGLFIGLGFKYLQDLFAPTAAVFNVPELVSGDDPRVDLLSSRPAHDSQQRLGTLVSFA